MELAQHYTPQQTNIYHLFDHVDTPQLKPLIKASRKAMTNLTLDFSQVQSLDMNSLKGLIKLVKNYRQQNLTVSLMDVPMTVQTYLELTQIDQLFANDPSQHLHLPYSA